MAPRRPAEPRPRTSASADRGGRRAGRLVVASAAIVTLAFVGGCAESRRAAYEVILSGEIDRADVDPERFAAAFPERRTPPGTFAVADADR